MQVLLLNLTGNENGWEDQNVDEIRQTVEGHGNDVSVVAAHGTAAVMDASRHLSGQRFDFTIVVAHGAATEPISHIGLGSAQYEQVLNNPYLLPSVFPSVWRNHKLLIVCEGLNSDAMAALAVGLPDNPVSEDSLLIAKRTSVYPGEAVRLAEGIFSRIGSSANPAKTAVDAALANSRESDEWLGIEGTNVVEE